MTPISVPFYIPGSHLDGYLTPGAVFLIVVTIPIPFFSLCALYINLFPILRYQFVFYCPFDDTFNWSDDTQSMITWILGDQKSVAQNSWEMTKHTMGLDTRHERSTAQPDPYTHPRSPGLKNLVSRAQYDRSKGGRSSLGKSRRHAKMYHYMPSTLFPDGNNTTLLRQAKKPAKLKSAGGPDLCVSVQSTSTQLHQPTVPCASIIPGSTILAVREGLFQVLSEVSKWV